jgi:O-antigen/teichoic acid export membrane protein
MSEPVTEPLGAPAVATTGPAPARSATAEIRSSFALRSAAAAGGLLATLLTTVVAVRFLADREAATFLSVLAGLMIGPMFGKLGLGQNVIRLVAATADEQRRRQIIGSHLRASFVLSVLSAPVLAFAATAGLLGRPDQLPALGLTAVLLVTETLRLLLSDIFAAVGDVRGSVATTHHVRTVVVLPALGAVVAMVAHPDLVQMLSVYSVVSVLLLAFALVRARHVITVFGRLPDARMMATIGTGLVLFALDASVFVIGRGDVWLANAAFEPFDAARYGTVSVLAFQVSVITGLTSLAITPVAARMWAAGRREAVLRLLSAAATLTTAATAVVVLGLVALGRPVLALAYGPEFADSYPLLVLLALGGLGQAVFGFNVPLLLVSGQIRRAVSACLVVVVVMTPLTAAAAIWGGPTALAAVTAVAALALPGGVWVAARRTVPSAPLPSWRIGASIRSLRSSAPVTPAAEPVG